MPESTEGVAEGQTNAMVGEVANDDRKAAS